MILVLSDSARPRTVATLADHFQTSTKSIRRSIEDIRRCGIDVTETAGPHNKKSYMISNRELPLISLAFDEALAVFLARVSLSAFEGCGLSEAAKSAYEKIRRSLGNLEVDYLDRILPRVHSTQLSPHTSQNEFTDLILIAIEDRKAIEIKYLSAKSTQPLAYEIHPYGLAEHRGSLYVVGHSCHHHEIRTWKLDRMSSVEFLKHRFPAPLHFDLSEFFGDAFAVVTGKEDWLIRIGFNQEATQFIGEKKFHRSQQVERHADGTSTVSLRLNSLLEVKSWVLSFGAKAKVLEPQQLIDDIKRDIASLTSSYHSEVTDKAIPNSKPRKSSHLKTK
jgi:predicted DNA-binding transcriptional regulator YafY